MINTLPLVTIAIPTYNRADCYLKDAIQSAVSQTYLNIEIIVSDNCSTDNTQIVVKEFNDSRIIYFKHSRNVGSNSNANFCVKQAQGDYILLLHDDDMIDNDFVDACLKAVNYTTDIGIIRTGTRWIDSGGELLLEFSNRACGLSTEDFFRAFFAGKTAMYLCSTLFNTKRLREIGCFNSQHNLFDDVIAEVKLAAKYGRQDIYEIKASNRKHPFERTFSAKVSNWCDDSLMLVDLICELVSENKAIVRDEGMRFLSQTNYRLTSKINSSLIRFFTYLIVFKKFKYKFLPPPAIDIIYNNPFFNGARYIKRRIIPKY